MRITNKMLELKVEYLNEITGNPKAPYSKGKDGKHRANIGNYHLSFAYGGVCVHKMHNEGGGVTTPIVRYHVKKRELYEKLCSYIDGINYGKELKNTNNKN